MGDTGRGIMRIEILSVDRPYMAFDILRVFVNHQVNVIWLEVYTYVTYIKFDPVDAAVWEEMKREILAIPGVHSLKDIGLIAFEQREQLIETILDVSNNGVLVAGPDGNVRLANAAAKRLLREQQSLEGRPLVELLPAHDLLRGALETGKSFSNQSLLFERSSGMCHLLAEGKAMKNEAGQVEGIIITVSDMDDVRKMVHSLTRARSITFADILSRSDEMHKLIALAETIAGSDPTVLIRGESGTGKELFARAIHAASRRSNQAFVPINCAALPETLIESELFGYEDGAFSGARRGGKQGLFELANGGTLFLDEVAELSVHVQAKLLRVLQEGTVRRVGGQREIPVNVRIVAATNRDLEGMRKNGQFREDLYYRLHVIPLFIPPLRSHPEDIPMLAEHYCRRVAEKLDRQAVLSPTAQELLLQHPWPGNVRELANVVERAVYLAAGGTETVGPIRITPEHLFMQPVKSAEAPSRPAAHPTLRQAVAATERELIFSALKQYGSIRAAAKALGVTHTLLLNRLKKLQIPHPTGETGTSS